MHILHLQFLLFLYGPLSLRNCCHKPLLVTELREQKCMMKYGPSSSLQSYHMANAKCYYNCTTDGIDLTDDEHHHLSKEKILNYLEELFGESYPDWTPVIETSIDTCLAKIKLWKSQKKSSVWSRLWAQHNEHHHGHNDMADSDCDPSGGVLFSCLESELVHHCPNNQWDASPNCQHLIEHSKHKDGSQTLAKQPSSEQMGI